MPGRTKNGVSQWCHRRTLVLQRTFYTDFTLEDLMKSSEGCSFYTAWLSEIQFSCCSVHIAWSISNFTIKHTWEGIRKSEVLAWYWKWYPIVVFPNFPAFLASKKGAFLETKAMFPDIVIYNSSLNSPLSCILLSHWL